GGGDPDALAVTGVRSHCSGSGISGGAARVARECGDGGRLVGMATLRDARFSSLNAGLRILPAAALAGGWWGACPSVRRFPAGGRTRAGWERSLRSWRTRRSARSLPAARCLLRRYWFGGGGWPQH